MTDMMGNGDDSPQNHRDPATDADLAEGASRLSNPSQRQRYDIPDAGRYRQQRREQKAHTHAHAAASKHSIEPAALLSAEQKEAREKNRAQRQRYKAKDPERYRRQRREEYVRRRDRARLGLPPPAKASSDERRALKAAQRRRYKEADPDRFRRLKRASERRRRARRKHETATECYQPE